ncbi:WD40-repeat-containing domain protein [Dipodascopsis tothii]|uniref:WD40-repeat-containing domain protein n=1 Tax=Dipodascopsis tothii TaxID=44089 RepID=UPI0034CFC0B8
MSSEPYDEILVYGQTPKDGADRAKALQAANLHSSKPMRAFNGSVGTSKSVYAGRTYVACAQHDKPILLVYSYAKDSAVQKIVLPETAECLAFSHSEQLLAVGTPGGKLLLWEVASGNCLFYREAHYQAVRAAVFSADDSLLVTAGGDGRISSWRVLDLVTAAAGYRPVQPVASASQHSLAVTALAAGPGGDQRLYSCSDDRTLRVWDLRTLRAAQTAVFPERLTSVALDPAERCVYVGCADGRVFQLDLVGRAVGRAGADVIEIDAVTHGQQAARPLHHHTAAVGGLAVSTDGTRLVSGSLDGRVHVWDTSTQQVLRTVRTAGLPVYYVGVVAADLAPVRRPGLPVEKLRRAVDERAAAEHSAWVRPCGAADDAHFARPL